MVVALKHGKVIICINPKDIKNEHHPMKTIEEITSRIPNAKLFSKLDAKSGFLQIRLDEPPSYITTFNTSICGFVFHLALNPHQRFTYQRVMDEKLEGIEGAFAIIDDILIAGRNREHHDSILKKDVESATQYNLKLNFDKTNRSKVRRSRDDSRWVETRYREDKGYNGYASNRR